jgi:hypothetical protein
MQRPEGVTYIFISRATVYCTHDWRRIISTPSRPRKIIGFFGITLEQMLDRTWNLFDLARHVKEIHLIVLLAHLIRQAASPRLDLIELVFFLIVASLTDIDLLVWGKIAGTTSAVASEEHDETTIDDFFDPVIAVLARLHHFIRVEVLLKVMHGLLGSVVPAGVDPFLVLRVLPCPVDLADNGLGHIVRVLNVNPVTNLPQLVPVQNAIG